MRKKEEKNESRNGIESLTDEFLRDMGIGGKEEKVERPEVPEELLDILRPEKESSYKETKEKEPVSFSEYSFEEEPLPKEESLPLEAPFSFPEEEEPTYSKTTSEEPEFLSEPMTSPEAFSFPEEEAMSFEKASSAEEEPTEPMTSPEAFSFPEEDFSTKESLEPTPTFNQEPTPSPDAFSFLEKEEEPVKSYEEAPFIEEPGESLPPKTPKEEIPIPSQEKISEIMASLEEGERQEGLSELEEIFEERPEDVHHEEHEEDEYIIEKPTSKKKKSNILKFAVIGSFFGIILMAGGYFGYKYLSPKAMSILPKIMGGLLKGSIKISSEPTSSDVFLDDVLKGKTPLSIPSLPLSEYEVKITKEGYLEWKGSVELSMKNRKGQITANLSPIPTAVEASTITLIGTGTLSVKTSPVAVVYIDGRPVRRMPVVLDEGVHTITVNKAGYYTFRRQIEIKPGEELKIQAKLSLKEGSLFIDSVPRFAEVIFEGKSKGRTPLVIPNIPSFQPFRIKIKKEGWASWQGMTFTEPGERTKIMALLGKREGEKKEPEKMHFIMPKAIESERGEQRPSIAELQKQIKVFEGGLKFPEKRIEDKIQKEETKFPEWTMDEIIPQHSYSEPELFKMPQQPIIKKERTQLPEAIKGPGYCFITSIPAGAEILVDGRSIGKTPIRSVLIGAGKHTLIARKEGLSDVKKEVTISGEATNFFNLILPK
jgi:hypothetical protein